MLIEDTKPEKLMRQICGSMLRQLRSGNPVLNPAVCSITPEEIADLEEIEMLFVTANVKTRMESDELKADVQVIKTADSPPAYFFVGTLPG